ncbi:hypothetical protein COCMIDRAFT_35414 [Bipolaris oryzae ATCC 44560]|uniref:Ricin B lectin domain-containing protein n=1 Tax=Bipolaris oryzae ATCC 44560 TaxID=930090 RepID=W6ZAG2_COCMI|nr:uncharacterized protein COCMIDRAFT_35414 [Bipolaris oryzae ATCC 44560]EUC46975.1 hypothetical protein COCMIDRAFT_35414 [Bipolaris oryzae ATCC 44560]
MLTTIILGLALAVTSLAQAPEGHRTVYITSAQDANFVVVPKSRTAGAPLVVQSLIKSPSQTWYLAAPSNGTSIQLASTTLCMDAGPKSGTGTKQCLDLQYIRAVENNPVGMYNCAGLGNTGAKDKGINWPLKDA